MNLSKMDIKDEDPSARHRIQIEIARIELGQGFEAAQVSDHHLPVAERHQAAFAQFPQDAVGVDRGQAQALTEFGLVDRERKAFSLNVADDPQPLVKFAQEVGETRHAATLAQRKFPFAMDRSVEIG